MKVRSSPVLGQTRKAKGIMMFNLGEKSLSMKNLLKPALLALLMANVSSAALAQESSDEGGGDTLEKMTGVPVHGFANMGFAEDSATDDHRRLGRGFYLNNFDLYYSPDLGNRVRFLSEVVFEPDAGNQQPTFDAERLQAGYVVNNNLTVWIGRFHTPIGYYVLAYHHGGLLQTAVEKPRFLDFEDHYGVLPVHTNGLWLNGSATAGDQRFAIMGWVGNSDRIVTDGAGFSALDFDMSHNENGHLSVGGRVNWIMGGKLDGVQMGVTAMKQIVDYMGTGQTTFGATGGTDDSETTPNPNTGGGFSVDFLMYGAHLVYEGNGFEWINELYSFHDSNLKDINATGVNSSAGFSQLAYWWRPDQAPYARYERGAFNQNDPYFAGQYNGLPYSKLAYGYRYSLNDNAALKMEFSHTGFTGSSNTNTGQAFNDLHLDYSIRF